MNKMQTPAQPRRVNSSRDYSAQVWTAENRKYQPAGTRGSERSPDVDLWAPNRRLSCGGAPGSQT